jgi:hypothetical protein
MTAWSRVLEKPPTIQIFNNVPKTYGTRKSITVFIGSIHWFLYWAR